MAKDAKHTLEIEETNGFVPVQYKILKLDAKYIANPDTIEEEQNKDTTGKTKYYHVKEIPLLEWLTVPHGNCGLVSVGDNILFQKIREVKMNDAGEETEDTPNMQQYKAYKHQECLRKDIKNLKMELENKPDEKKVENLIEKMMELEQFLFVPDVINVESSGKGIYDKFAKKGFYYGDRKYVRRSAGSSNLKQNTVTFVEESINNKLIPKLRVGFTIGNIETSEILAPEKFGAYEGLTTTGCIFVTKPRVVVIPDFEHITFRDKDNKDHLVYYVEKHGGKRDPEGKPVTYDVGTRTFYETKPEGAYLNSFDGMGLISPDFAMQWRRDLRIGYLPSAFNVRSIGVKGLLVTFPIKEYARKKGFKYIVDVKYKGKDRQEIEYIPVEEVDIILTESQWKYKKLYKDRYGIVGNDFSSYNNNPEAIWGVQRVNPKEDADCSRLNYQLIMTNNIRTDEDIQKVIDPTENYLKLITSGKPEYLLYALTKEVEMINSETSANNEDSVDIDLEDESADTENCTDDEDSIADEIENIIKPINAEELKTTILNKALLKNHDLLGDKYVNLQVRKIIDSIMKRAKCGKIYPEHNSNYQFMISDPYGLVQWAFNWFDWMKEVGFGEDRFTNIKKIPQNAKEERASGIGLIPPKTVYSNYWNKKNVSKIDACRSPMTDISEHNVLDVCNADNTAEDIYSEMQTYYRYIRSGIIYSLHDLSTVVHSDSDFDSDMVCTFDSDVFIRNAWGVYPTTYEKGVDNMESKNYTVENAIESDKKGFGNKVGVYSNNSTSSFAMIPMFEGERHEDPDYPEYDCSKDQLEIYKIIKKGRYIIGEEIDSTKTGQKPEKSSDFEPTNVNASRDEIRKYNQTEIDAFANKLLEIDKYVPQFMPYFFINVKTNYNEKYTRYITQMREICKMYTYESIDKFVPGVLHGTRELETADEKTFWDYFKAHSPLLLTDCTMNKICWKLEMFEKDIDTTMKEKWKDAEKYILMSYAKEVKPVKKQREVILAVYTDYLKGINEIYNKNNHKGNSEEKKSLYQIGKRNLLIFNLRKRLLEELECGFTDIFNLMVDVLKNKYPSSKLDSINGFIWNIMGEDILSVIPQNKKWLYKEEGREDGVEILGKNVYLEWRDRA